MKDIIVNIIKEHITNFSTKCNLSPHDIELLCEEINNKFHDKYQNNELCNKVILSVTPHKWIEDGDDSMTAIDADGWDDAEELNFFMSIQRTTPRKDKNLHKEIIEKSISILKKVISMDFFEDFSDDGIWQEECDGKYETVTMISFYMPSFYSNHKSFHNH